MSGTRRSREQSRLQGWHRVSRTLAPDVIVVLAVIAYVLVGLDVLNINGPIEVGAPFTLAALLYRLRERRVPD